MAALVIQQHGVAISWANPTPVTGDTFENDEHIAIFITVEAGAGSKALTVPAVRDCDARHGAITGALVDYTITITEGSTIELGPEGRGFKGHFYNDKGKATVKFDSVTGVQIAAVRIPLGT